MPKPTFEELETELHPAEKPSFEELEKELGLETPDVLEIPKDKWHGVQPIWESEGQMLGIPAKKGYNHKSAIDMSNLTGMPHALIRDREPQLSDIWNQFKTDTDNPFDIRLGLGETVQRMDATDYIDTFVPFAPARAVELIKIQRGVSRLTDEKYEDTEEGNNRRESDVKMVEDFFNWQEELAVRGQTYGSKAFEGLIHLPKWMIEFMLTGGLAKMGSVRAQNMATKILSSYVHSPGGRVTLKAAGWTGGAITRASLGLTHRVAEETMKRKLPKQVKFGNNDEFTIETEGGNWASSILKGWGDVVIEAASEEAGEFLVSKLPFGRKISEGIFTEWLKKNPKGTITKFWNEFFTKAGYSNIIGEIGEERLATILRAVLNTEDFGLPADSTIDERLSAGLTADMRNFPVEALVLAVPGATRYAGGRILSKFDNPTMEVVNRYNGKIKEVQSKGDTESVEKLKLMEQYELAQLAKPVYTAYQKMERAKPFDFKLEEVEEIPDEEVEAAEAKPPAEPAVEAKQPLSELVAEVKEAWNEFVETRPLINREHKQRREAAEKRIKEARAKLSSELPSKGTEPWQMTKRQFEAQAISDRSVLANIEAMRGTLAEDTGIEHLPHIPEVEATTHRREVEKAVQKGKPVPRYVLEEYKSEPWAQEALKKAEPAVKPIEEKRIPPTENDFNQSMLDNGATEAQQSSQAYLGVEPPTDIDIAEPTDEDVGFIKHIFHRMGLKEKGGYEPLSEKDFRNIYRFLQMPNDIAKTFPQFAPVYEVQRGAELAKTVLDDKFAESTLPYFQLNANERKKVDAVLIEAEQNPQFVYGPKRLSDLGLNEQQIKGFLSARSSLDLAKQLLIQKMKDNDVSEKVIEDFSKNVVNYVPHKWYGRWANVVKDAEGKVIFMTKTNYTDRFTERDRLKKLFPEGKVTTMKSNKMPREFYDQAPGHAVFQVLNKIMKEAEADEGTKQIMQQALADLYKSKGFASHYISRKNIPGFTEDLQRPLAEYFNGITGYLTMIDKVKAFPQALAHIDPSRTPNLYAYSANYIKYVTGEEQEFPKAKQAAYYYYLFGNIKSAAMNATQNFVLGWPELSKRTNFSLAYMMQAMARTVSEKMLTEGEKQFLAEMESKGYLDPKLAQEVSGYAGKPMYTTLGVKTREAVNFLDIFRHIERFNRRSMAVALYDAGITNHEDAIQHIENSHFHYGKSNRPTLMRGPISPVMTFRSFMVNYATWVKNEIKAKRLTPATRSGLALIFFGGLKALPLFGAVAYIWRKIFGTDLEGEAREVMGNHAGKLLFRGVPTEAGISFTGSVSPIEIPSNIMELGGVFADQGRRVYNVTRDIRIGDYKRALEDASPEILRNPLAAYRMHTQGIRARSGEAVVDIETGRMLKTTAAESALKSIGFQPSRISEQWDISNFIRNKTRERAQRKQLWVDKFFLSFLNKDLESMKDVINEINSHNTAMKKRGRDNDVIEMAEMNDMLKNRMGIANVPQKSMLDAFAEIRSQYYGD